MCKLNCFLIKKNKKFKSIGITQMPHFNSVNRSSISRVLLGLIYALAFACETSCDQLVFHLIYYFPTDIHL